MLHFIAEVGHFIVSLNEVLQLLMKHPGKHFSCQGIGRDFQGGTCFLSEVLCLRGQAVFFQGASSKFLFKTLSECRFGPTCQGFPGCSLQHVELIMASGQVALEVSYPAWLCHWEN